MNANSESMRCRFVQHDGKKELIVRRDDFVIGSPENPWSEVLGEFTAQIKKHIGEENHSSIVVSFSTTGAIEKAANEIVLMGSLKSYFEYEVHTRCGIPEVKLEGTAEDWSELPKRAEVLGSRYDLAWWTDRIVPTLEQIARNAAGADDPELWNNIYKIDKMSGGPYINGWLVDFFPYLQTTGLVEQRNWLFSGEGRHGITTESLPGSLCTTPFKWQYFGREYGMEFVAGFIGFTQSEEDLAVRPKIGWAVR